MHDKDLYLFCKFDQYKNLCNEAKLAKPNIPPELFDAKIWHICNCLDLTRNELVKKATASVTTSQTFPNSPLLNNQTSNTPKGKTKRTRKNKNKNKPKSNCPASPDNTDTLSVNLPEINKLPDLCVKSCKHDHKHSTDMLRCCMCMIWYHDDCVNEKDKNPGVWMCPDCRTLPSLVKEMSSKMTTVWRELSSLQSTNMELVHALGRKSLECDRLREEMSKLQKTSVSSSKASVNLPKIKSKISQGSTTSSSQAIKSTIIGSSLVRGLGESINCETLDACVYVNPGRDLPQIRSHIPNMLKNKPDVVVLQAGSIDVTEHNEKEIIYEYEKTVKSIKSANNDVTTVFLSTIPVRRNLEHDRRASRVNNFIRHITTKDHRLQLIENNNIRLADLDTDGIHLSDQGKVKLGCNIRQQIQRWIDIQDGVQYNPSDKDFPLLERHLANR